MWTLFHFTSFLFFLFIGFYRVIGAMDDSYIPISAYLGENEGKIVNRRSFQCAGDLVINNAHFTLALHVTLVCLF